MPRIRTPRRAHRAPDRSPILDNSLHAFRARWTAIAAGSISPPSDDPSPDRSTRFHAVDSDKSIRRVARITGWLDSIAAVESFVDAVGDLPRNSPRSRVHPRAAGEPHLARWLRAQRAHQINGRLCAYQEERLLLLPGFEWQPLFASWDDHVDDFMGFLSRHARTPSRHANDSTERALAVWHRNQKVLLRDGRLIQFKVQDLRRIEHIIESLRDAGVRR